MHSKSPPPESISPTSRVPSHLYKRDGLYYFRFVFPEPLRQRFNRTEVRVSLRTAYRRKALDLSGRLYVYFFQMVESDPMIPYQELKRRLNLYLQTELQTDYNYVLPTPAIDEYFAPVEEFADDPTADRFLYPGASLYRHRAEVLQEATKDPESLEQWSEFAIKELAKCGLLFPSEINQYNRRIVTKAFLESQVTYYKILEQQSQGDYLDGNAIISADFGELPTTPSAERELKELVRKDKRLREKKIKTQVEAEHGSDKSEANSQPRLQSTMLYSEAVRAFIKDKLDENRWKPHMVPEHEGQLKTFLDVMGDMPIIKITRNTMKDYRNTLAKMPPNHTRSPEYKGKTVSEILKMAPKAVLSSKRVNTLVQAVSSLMGWLMDEKEGIISSNPAVRLQKQDERQVIDLRFPFEKRDLVKIFSHPKFAEGKFKFADYFWPPLIALFSGMRLEEICQLHCKDIYEIEGLWIIDINTKGIAEDGYGKNLKNPSATRLVPVHSTLIDLGFLRYVERIAGQNRVRVFPNLNKSDNVGKYGKQAGKQFNDLVRASLKTPDYDPNGKVFHSLRHNFADFYKQRGLQTDAFRQLYGHGIPYLAARQYGSKFPPDLLNEVISALDYDLDLSMLKKSKYIREVAINEC